MTHFLWNTKEDTLKKVLAKPFPMTSIEFFVHPMEVNRNFQTAWLFWVDCPFKIVL